MNVHEICLKTLTHTFLPAFSGTPCILDTDWVYQKISHNIHGYWSIGNRSFCYILFVCLFKGIFRDFGLLKHPFSLTPIDTYSLERLIVQNSSWLWFQLCKQHMICGITWIILLNWILYCNFWYRASEIQKCNYLLILSKLFCFYRSPIEVRLVLYESSFWICKMYFGSDHIWISL